jgi:flagellar hook assembly protein FlgD
MRSRINPAGDHIWLYIDYSTDYGETFITYFHDLDSTITGIKKLNMQNYELRNYPNPFTDKTVITFQLPENTGGAKLKIYDLAGKTIKEYSINNKNQITWNGTDKNNRKVKSGIYLYIFEINGKNIASNKI